MSHKTQQEEALPELKAAVAASSIRISTVSIRSKRREPEPDAEDGGVDAAATTETTTAVVKKKRCFGCAKRVGLTGFRCRCGEVFCAVHRYSDRHECSYDYKAAGREAIARENPVVRAAKILKV